MSLPEGGPDQGLESRLRTLAHQLSEKAMKKEGETLDEEKTQASMASSARAYAIGARALSELVGGVLVGAAIGWGIDYGIGTPPIFLIIFFVLGFLSGVWNLYIFQQRTSLPQQEENFDR